MRRILSIGLIAILLMGCSTKVVQNESDSLEKITKNKNTLVDKLKQDEIKKKQRFIYLSSKKKLSQVLNELSYYDGRTYVLKSEDIELNGYPNLKFNDFFSLNAILKSIYKVEMRITENEYGVLPKIIELVPLVKLTILDKLKLNQNSLLEPSALLENISSQTNGWRINYDDVIKEDFKSLEYVNFKGTIREFLNFYATNNDYYIDYDYVAKKIRFTKFKSKLFRLKASKEKYTFTNNINVDLNSGTGKDSSSKSTSGVALEDSYNIYDNLEATLKKIIPVETEEEYYNIIKDSGHITVSTTNKKMKTIENLINTINEDSFKNVYLKVTLVETKITNSHSRGIDWGYVKDTVDNSGNLTSIVTGAINGSYADLSEAIPSDSFFKYRGKNGLTAIVKALNKFGDTGVTYNAPIVTTNNVPAIWNLSNLKDYIYETEIDNENETPTISAKQNEVQAGNYLYVKPSVFDKEILVSIKMVSSRRNPFEKHEFQNSGYLQSKDIDKKLLSQNIVLKNGEKVIIGGISQQEMNGNYSGLDKDGKSITSGFLGVNDKSFNSNQLALVIEAVIL